MWAVNYTISTAGIATYNLSDLTVGGIFNDINYVPPPPPPVVIVTPSTPQTPIVVIVTPSTPQTPITDPVTVPIVIEPIVDRNSPILEKTANSYENSLNAINLIAIQNKISIVDINSLSITPVKLIPSNVGLAQSTTSLTNLPSISIKSDIYNNIAASSNSTIVIKTNNDNNSISGSLIFNNSTKEFYIEKKRDEE